MTSFLKRHGDFLFALFVTFIVGTLTLASGCSLALKGGGEISMGMRNDNFLVLRSTVDGDKQGKTSNVTLTVDDRLLATPEDPNDPDPNPAPDSRDSLFP